MSWYGSTTPGCGGTLGGPGGGGIGGGGGSSGLRRCLNRLVSFLTKDRGSLCGSSVKDQGLKGLADVSLSGLGRSSLEFSRIRFLGGCNRVGVRGRLTRESVSTSRTPESSECAGPEQESSSSPPDTKPASRSNMRSETNR